MKQIWSLVKPYVKWGIFGATIFFLLKTFKDRWQEILSIRITQSGWLCLIGALLITTIAHLFSGWVWISIIRSLKQPMKWQWGLQVYLKTNIAKYLPGNMWHFYGRIKALTNTGYSLSLASFSVLLEPILLAATAFAIAFGGLALGLWSIHLIPINKWIQGLLVLSFSSVLIGIHPKILNRVIQLLRQLKGQVGDTRSVKLDRYPWMPLISAFTFLVLRGIGFSLTLLALMPLAFDKIPLLVSAFSLSWLLGFVIPGAPGGLGIFETTALLLLEHQVSSGVLLSGLALFRVISISAEIGGAGLAIISEK